MKEKSYPKRIESRPKEKFSLGEKTKILFSNSFQDTLIHTIQLYLCQEKIRIRMRQPSAIDHETAPRSDGIKTYGKQ